MSATRGTEESAPTENVFCTRTLGALVELGARSSRRLLRDVDPT